MERNDAKPAAAAKPLPAGRAAAARKQPAVKTKSRVPRAAVAAPPKQADTAGEDAGRTEGDTQAAAEAVRSQAPRPQVAAGPAVKSFAAAPAVLPAKPKLKLVRDSFTMPQADFSLIDLLKARSLDAKRPAKKSELLRAGLHALAALDPAQLQAALAALEPLKPGRPKKHAD